MFEKIKKKVKASGNKSFLNTWKRRTDDGAEGMFYIKRNVEETELYYDVYWFVKRSASSHYIDSIYHRCDKTMLRDMIRRVEEKELPELLVHLCTTDIQKENNK